MGVFVGIIVAVVVISLAYDVLTEQSTFELGGWLKSLFIKGK